MLNRFLRFNQSDVHQQNEKCIGGYEKSETHDSDEKLVLTNDANSKFNDGDVINEAHVYERDELYRRLSLTIRQVLDGRKKVV